MQREFSNMRTEISIIRTEANDNSKRLEDNIRSEALNKKMDQGFNKWENRLSELRDEFKIIKINNIKK